LLKKSKNAINKLCWERERGLYAESPELKGEPVSQHSQVMPILAQAASKEQCDIIMKKMFTDKVKGYMLKPYGYFLKKLDEFYDFKSQMLKF